MNGWLWWQSMINMLKTQLANLKKTKDGGEQFFYLYNGVLHAQGVDLLVPWAVVSMQWPDA
jgi:hypothetical protein